MRMKYLLEYISGVILSIIGFICFGIAYDLLRKIHLDYFFGGDKSNVFFGLFLGLPIGSILGFCLIEKIYFKVQGFNILGTILGLIINIFACFIGVIFLDKFGEKGIILIPFLIVLLILISYNISYFIKR